MTTRGQELALTSDAAAVRTSSSRTSNRDSLGIGRRTRARSARDKPADRTRHQVRRHQKPGTGGETCDRLSLGGLPTGYTRA
jgi:hypothetical protein